MGCERSEAAVRSDPGGSRVTRVEDIEQRIRSLSVEELIALREWFARFDAELWDRQFEVDVRAGKLDGLAERALRAHANGQSTKL